MSWLGELGVRYATAERVGINQETNKRRPRGQSTFHNASDTISVSIRTCINEGFALEHGRENSASGWQ